MSTASRLYQDPADLETIIELLKRIRPRYCLNVYPSLIDLQELLSLPEVRARTRLWFNQENCLIGYAFVDEMSNLHFEADPGGGAAFEATLLDWAIAEARRAVKERCRSNPPGLSCRSDDQQKMALLKQRGFRCFPGALQLERKLDQPIPIPVLSPGFAIRPSVGASEAEAWVALHRAAHGTEIMTVDRRLSIIEVDEFDPALDLVAVAPDGRLAAYCVGSIHARENELTGRKDGYTDPVATHPDFQRRGLCRALLSTALRLLKERGMETARLSTSQENQAMRKAAQAVGFQIESQTYWYELAYP